MDEAAADLQLDRDLAKPPRSQAIEPVERSLARFVCRQENDKCQSVAG